MEKNMDIQHIRYFVEVAKCRSFSKAAQNLFVTQPILTRCIKNMEKELGVFLIIRSTRSFVLTDAGEELLRRGSQLVEQYEDIFRHIQDIKESSKGEIHISSPGVLLDMYFPRLVTEYRRKYPGVRINISESGSRRTEQEVLSGAADIGIVMLPLENPQELHIMPIISDEVCALIHQNHPFAKKERVHIRELEGEEIITHNHSNTLYSMLLLMCQEEGFLPNITYQSNMPNFMLDIISYGTCVGILPRPVAQQFQTRNLKSVPLEPKFPWKIAMITKKDRYLSRAAEGFLDFSRNFF